jgi:transposase
MIDPPYYPLGMAMGTRTRNQQPAIWVAVSDLPQSVSHPFYEQLNRLLAEQGFDDFVETQCRPFYADTMGRPSLAPGQYFRLLLLGYFEGLDSERGIAWRAADSLGVCVRSEGAKLCHGKTQGSEKGRYVAFGQR